MGMDVCLLFIGSPLLDVTSKCEPEYLKKYNLKPDDCVRATEEHKSLFVELLQNSSSVLQAGGSAQNSARICKWVLGDGGSVAFAGCVGDDEFASRMKERLIKDKVDPLYASHPTKPTGTCACLVDSDGERSMVTYHGAASTYSEYHLETPEVRSYMHKANAIFIVGYFLAHSPAVFKRVAEFCSKERKLLAISLSAPYICRDYADLLMECMPFVDVVFGNCGEAKEFVKHVAPDSICDKPSEYAKVLAEVQKHGPGGRVVIITDGTNPVTVCETNDDPHQYPVPKSDNLVETIGCGDALAGAFLATYVKTKSSSESIKSGIFAARKIAEMPGCALPEEDYAESPTTV